MEGRGGREANRHGLFVLGHVTLRCVASIVREFFSGFLPHAFYLPVRTFCSFLKIPLLLILFSCMHADWLVRIYLLTPLNQIDGWKKEGTNKTFLSILCHLYSSISLAPAIDVCCLLCGLICLSVNRFTVSCLVLYSIYPIRYGI